jgi:hypothetical protein
MEEHEAMTSTQMNYIFLAWLVQGQSRRRKTNTQVLEHVNKSTTTAISQPQA